VEGVIEIAQIMQVIFEKRHNFRYLWLDSFSLLNDREKHITAPNNLDLQSLVHFSSFYYFLLTDNSGHLTNP